MKDNNNFGIKEDEEISEIMLHFGTWLYKKHYSLFGVGISY